MAMRQYLGAGTDLSWIVLEPGGSLHVKLMDQGILTHRARMEIHLLQSLLSLRRRLARYRSGG